MLHRFNADSIEFTTLIDHRGCTAILLWGTSSMIEDARGEMRRHYRRHCSDHEPPVLETEVFDRELFRIKHGNFLVQDTKESVLIFALLSRNRSYGSTRLLILWFPSGTMMLMFHVPLNNRLVIVC